MSYYRENVICNDIKKINKQKKLNEFYMRIANEYAQRSHDPKYKVGCIIVTEEGIIYPGYNGDEIGGSNQRDSMDGGDSGFIHAEINSMIKFNPSLHKNCKMYVTLNPCKVCARTIVNTQSISEVYYSELYNRDLVGIDILKKAGIWVQYIKLREKQ